MALSVLAILQRHHHPQQRGDDARPDQRRPQREPSHANRRDGDVLTAPLQLSHECGKQFSGDLILLQNPRADCHFLQISECGSRLQRFLRSNARF
jgi:hypothetical protein